MFEFTIRENDFLNGFLDLLSEYVNKSYKFTMSYLTSPPALWFPLRTQNNAITVLCFFVSSPSA